jgi:hypothetical protein
MKFRPLPYLFLILFASMAWLSSCDDIIEPAISKSLVTAEAPADQFTSTSYKINFWWDPVTGALSKKLITLVSINGKDEMFSESETKDHVKLIKNLRDSIRISFNGKTKFITIKPPAL